MLSGIGKGGGEKSYNGGVVYAELGAIVQISPEYSTFFLFFFFFYQGGERSYFNGFPCRFQSLICSNITFDADSGVS